MDARIAPLPYTNKEMSAVRRPVVIENFHIFHSGQCENTF